MKKPFFLLLLVVLLVPVLLVHAQAARTATPEVQPQKAAEAEHGESWWAISGKWVNFVALIAILYLFLTRTMKVPDRFRKDFEDIQVSIERARRAREEAELRLKELDARMTGVGEEVDRIRHQASIEAEEEKKRIVEAAHKEAERIVQVAHREIDSEVELAKKNLRKQVADLSVEQGRKIIQQEINESDQKRLIQDYIEEIGK